MQTESTLKKVIIRTRDGRTIAGFARRETFDDEVRILNQKGKEESYQLDDLKGIFFVRDFKGDPEYVEVKFLNKHQAPPNVWVRVELFDGEVLEGRIENNSAPLLSCGFYLWPSDEDTNNEFAYIPKTSLSGFTVLSVT